MNVTVQPFNVRGKPLFKADREKNAPISGLLTIFENRQHFLGRVVLVAELRSATDGLNTLLLELFDVTTLYLSGNTMRVRGFEKIDEVQYAQTWEIKVINVKG